MTLQQFINFTDEGNLSSFQLGAIKCPSEDAYSCFLVSICTL